MDKQEKEFIEGFKTYLTDIVDRWNNKLMGEPGTNVEGFSQGNCVIFPEGPWWTSLNYDPNMNIKELRVDDDGTWETAGKGLGVSEEDATDPVISRPMVAMNTAGFWTLEENMSLPTATSWYGNGHAFSITRNCESATTALASLEFAKWYTQGKDDDGHYHLAKWATGGHIPAWKNVFADEHYQEVHQNDLTLRALGDPQKVIAMEPLPYEKTIFDSEEEAMEYLKRASNHGSFQAEYTYGKMLFEQGKKEEARVYFDKCAREDAWTEARVGLLYYYEYQDYEKGKELLKDSAEQGYTPAKESLKAIEQSINAQIVIGVCDLFYYASNIIEERCEDMYSREHQVSYHGIDRKQRKENQAKRHGMSW